MLSFKLSAAAALALVATSTTNAAPTDMQLEERTFGLLAQFKRQYGCKAPWLNSSKPYWCYGKKLPGIPIWDGGEGAKCKSSVYAHFNPWCQEGNQPQPLPSSCQPPVSGGDQPVCVDGYQQVFQNYESVAQTGAYAGQVTGAATIDNDNYLTYGLSTSAQGCLDICDATQGCVFVNVYQDNAASPEDVDELPQSAQQKYTPGQLTCALYKACSGTDKLTNWAGQQDPTFITQSSGYCKGAQCQA